MLDDGPFDSLRSLRVNGEDSGSGTGYWLSAGVHLRMLEHLNLGLSMRVSRADVEVFGIRSNAGGGQFGFTAGVSFGFPKRSR